MSESKTATLGSPGTTPPSPVGTPLIEVTDLHKAFGATRALNGCSFTLRAGEVHALVGENGSGKSTLVKVLSGVHHPDAGSISIGGEGDLALRSPGAAQQLGVFTVFQEVLAAESRSVLENVWLGSDSLFRTRVPRAEKRKKAEEALARLLGEAPRLDRPVEELPLSVRQACGIVRALLREPRVLILDESTSALDVATRDRLFEIVGDLSRAGTGVILITHRMDEIEEIGDRITVLRSGTAVGTVGRGEWDQKTLVRMMTGSDQLTEHVREERVARPRTGKVVIGARGLQLNPTAAAFDVEVQAGELVGVAGLEGHGQQQFLAALWGGPKVAGEVVIHGEDGGEVAVTSPAQASANRIAYVPLERRRDALFETLSISENFAVRTLRGDTRAGWLRTGAAKLRLRAYVDALKIKLGDPGHGITTLSGGNQQKVVIARWLATKPRVLLLNDPTRGIDVNAKRDLYALLTELANEGLSVVMFSTELDEHIELMDRVLVFRQGELSAEMARSDLSRDGMVANFFGQGDEEEGE